MMVSNSLVSSRASTASRAAPKAEIASARESTMRWLDS